MQVFLVRHGDSPFTANSDYQRPLSDLGAHQAQQAGTFIKRNSVGPHKIICSDALRTQMTAQLIDQVIQAESTSAWEHLYHARVGDWCDIIQQHEGNAVLVLVGHNPTMSTLAKYLQPLDHHVFSPACVAHFQLELAEDGLKLPAQLIEFYKPDAK